ncbi:MAG: hypothetical protein LBH07_05975 [Treponema sp.]|jgi:hypothetical protein|nr:hypothetical protein [Treponema sp.]
MESPKIRLYFFLLFFMIACTSFLYTQDNESGFLIKKTEEGFKVSQIIYFPAVPEAFRYEVEIEQIKETGFIFIEKIETKINKIELSLNAGSYRYRIISYNAMNLLDGRSEWQNFLVQPAIEPAAEGYRPFYALYYEIVDSTAVITVIGKGFTAESEFALVRPNKHFDWTGVSLENRQDVILPDRIEIDGSQAVLSFNRNALQEGEYDIFIRNPGGLWTVLGQVKAGLRKNTDFTFSFGYAPMIAAFDTENAWKEVNGSEIQQLDKFNPRGYYFRLGWIPEKIWAGNFGLEAQLFFLIDKEIQKDWADANDNSFRFLDTISSLTLNLLWQLPKTERWQHNMRLGIGSGSSYHSERDDSDKIITAWPLYFNFGYSTQYFFWKNLYAETGLDIQYVLLFGDTLLHMKGQNHLVFRPSLGLGLQMGRWAEYAEVSEGLKRGNDYSVPVTDIPRNEHLLSFGWSPMIPLFGIDLYGRDRKYFSTGYGTNVEQNERADQYLSPVNPLGVNIRYAYLPYRWGRNKLGFEFELSLQEHKNRHTFNSVDRGFESISELLAGIRYQRVLDKFLQINGRAAIGAANAYDYITEYNYDYYTGNYTKRHTLINYGFAFDIGASAQYFFWNNAYVEAGLDLVFILTKKTRSVLRPNLGIGWQFNRNSETGLRLPGTGLQQFKSYDSEPTPESSVVSGEALPDPAEYRLRREYLISLAWAPMIPAAGFEHIKLEGRETSILEPINPLGASLRYAWLPFQEGRNKIGMEYELSFLYLNHRKKFDDPVVNIFGEFLAGIRYQRIFDDQWQLNGRLALGLANQFNQMPDYILNAFKFGTSVQYFFRKNSYVETGLDFTLVRRFGDPLLTMRPSLGIGRQLNRD